jgi:type IV secretory pathway TraG/TraD family ATPase VirD4
VKNPAFVGGCIGLGVWLLLVNLLGEIGDAGGMGMVASILVGAVCAKALQRSLLGASSGFWHSVPGRWLVGRVAGLAVILLLVFPVFYGVRLAGGLLLLLLYDLGGATVVTLALKPVAVGAFVVTAVLVWRLRTLTKVIIGKSTSMPRAWYRSFTMGRGGSAGFASIMEEWANRWQPGMIFFGHSVHDRHWPVGVKDDRMVMTLAGNGGGKGVTSIIPNLLTYDRGSVFVHDTKGQNAAVTARARRAMGQDVFVLAPFAEETAYLNPLAGVDPEAPDYVERIKGIAEALVIAGEGKDRVWAEWSKIVIEGLIDLEIRYHEEETQGEES